MSADPFDRLTPPPATPRSAPDTGFAARARLVKLRDALVRAAKRLGSSWWNEPAVFFFDPRRQAELEAARPAAQDRFAELTALIESEMLELLATVEVRRVARAIDGLATAAKTLAGRCPAARDLSDILAVPDDEVFLVLTPATRTGVRLYLRGAVDVSQLRGLLQDKPNPPVPFPQLFAPTAIQPDGALPLGFAGCEHWLWPTQPLAGLTRIHGERVVLVGPVAAVQAPDPEPRFPTLAVECEVLQTLNAFQTAEALSRLCGQVIPVQTVVEATAVARAA